MAEENEGGGGGGNFLTRKLGPFPMYIWMGFGLGIALAITSWQGNKKKAAEAAAAASKTNTGTGPGNLSPSTQGIAGSLIPQFVNQVYTNNTPPAAAPTPAAPTPSNPVPVKQGEQLNASVFNTNGWTGDMFGAPWLMTVVQPGESWQDITTRVYDFGAKYSDITDPTAKARIDQVTPFIKQTNEAFTGLGPNGTGPAPGSIVVYR